MKAAFASLAATALALALPSPAGSGAVPAVPPAPDGLLVLAVLAPERVLIADPRTGATAERELPGGTLCHGPVLAVGDRVVFSGSRGGRFVALSAPLGRTGRVRALGPADTITPSSTPGRIWLSHGHRLREVGAASTPGSAGP